MKTMIVASGMSVLFLTGFAIAQTARTKSPDTARAYIISPKNGDSVSSPFTVQFGLKGIGVAPAGVDRPNTGHHHLLVDVATMPDMTMPLPMTENIRHFGGGQTEVELTLPAGSHTLQLLLGDAAHTPHDKPVMSDKITITVR